MSAAHRIERVLTDLDVTLAALRGAHSGRIAVGIVSTAKYIAPRLVAAFARQNPRVEVTITVGNRLEMVNQLRDYKIDVCLMGRPPSDFPVESVGHWRAPAGHHRRPRSSAYESARRIAKTDLAKENFIIREAGVGHAGGVRLFFSPTCRSGFRRSISKIGSNETIKQAVMAGLGPGAAVGTHDRSGARKRSAFGSRCRGPAAATAMVLSSVAPIARRRRLHRRCGDFIVAEAPKLLAERDRGLAAILSVSFGSSHVIARRHRWRCFATATSQMRRSNPRLSSPLARAPGKRICGWPTKL